MICTIFELCFCVSFHILTVVCGSPTKSLNDERLQKIFCHIQFDRFELVIFKEMDTLIRAINDFFSLILININ